MNKQNTDAQSLLESEAMSALDMFSRMESAIPERSISELKPNDMSYLNLIRARQSMHQVMTGYTFTGTAFDVSTLFAVIACYLHLLYMQLNAEIRLEFQADLCESCGEQKEHHKNTPNNDADADIEEIVLCEETTVDFFTERETVCRVDNFVEDEISFDSEYIPSGYHNITPKHSTGIVVYNVTMYYDNNDALTVQVAVILVVLRAVQPP